MYLYLDTGEVTFVVSCSLVYHHGNYHSLLYLSLSFIIWLMALMRSEQVVWSLMGQKKRIRIFQLKPRSGQIIERAATRCRGDIDEKYLCVTEVKVGARHSDEWERAETATRAIKDQLVNVELSDSR